MQRRRKDADWLRTTLDFGAVKTEMEARLLVEEGGVMPKQIGTALYWIGIFLALPFVLLIGASIIRMTSEGFQPQYVNSTFLGIFGAVFSYAVGLMLRHMLTENADGR
jgi:hypothetical protein